MDVVQLGTYEGLDLPEKQSEEAAGIDLVSTVEAVLGRGESVTIPTGLKVHIGSDVAHIYGGPYGLFGMILPRSGLGFNHFVRLANTAGVIDADYQGEIMVKIRNEGTSPLEIKRGDRVCQMIFMPYLKKVNLNLVVDFEEETARGEGGFGSTGQ